jgi:choline-sulfatase
MAEPMNLLVIMSDEHNPKVAGHAGHPVVETPALDALAARGTRFTAAYTPAPVCVPARASFATGLPVHRNRCWDNAIAYGGTPTSWHRALRDRGHHVASIGKLHYRGHAGEDYGFTESRLAMHITGGVGDVTLLIRDPEDVREAGGRKLLAQAGPGESEYTIYDRRIAAEAQIWLREVATRRHDKPWVLFVSLVSPHFPLTAPPEFFYRYAGRTLPRPKLYDAATRPTHPFVRLYGHRSNYDRHFRSEADLNRALAGYFGLVSFLDAQVANILAALDAAGLAGTTRIAYCSDHGDNLGARGLWGKSTMYEESVGIPLLLAGPDVPRGTCRTPVTLVDLAATTLDAVGAGDAIGALELPGASLLELAGRPPQDRAAFAEFHSMAPDAYYMLRTLRYKYVEYLGAPPQLFDLDADPEELHDLGTDPAHAATRAALAAQLRGILDPAAADAAAKRDQAAMIARHGGLAAIRAREKMAYTSPPVAAQ